MANVINTDIGDLSVSWENHSGEKVEKFIKSQLNKSCGYMYRSQNKEGDYYYLYGFHSYEDYLEWASGSIDVQPLFKTQLPNLESDSFTATLATDSNTTKLVNTGSGIKVNLRYCSIRTSVSTGTVSNTYNDGTLVISRSANGSGFVEVTRLSISPLDKDSGSYKSIDITNYLADGDNKIRMYVQDNTTGAMSNTVLFQSIVNTTLKVTNALDTSVPLNALQFKYYLEGQIAKTLHIKINNTYSYDFSVGSETYVETPFITGLIENDNITSGIIDVEAWLTVDDTTLESTHSSNQFYYINGTSSQSVIVLNNIQKDVVNYSNTKFFDFTIYNKDTDVDIEITVGTYTLSYTMKDCKAGSTYSFQNTLEIESKTTSLSGSVKVKTSDMTTSYSINVDNSIDMSPTSGANFVMNPKTRDNSETNPLRILNEADSDAEVSCTFSSGFDTTDGGWITTSEDSGKVLRILRGDYVEINYDPLDNLTYGTTIEFDYAVRDVFDDDSEVIGLYTTTDGKMLGYKQTATEGLYMTLNNQNERDQKIGLQTDTRTHIAINIIPNLSGSGLNYIRLFINGIINREMTYAESDTFKNGTVKMKFGSSTADCTLDIYGIRIYKSAHSASNVRQDYMSTKPDLDSKVAFNTANAILGANGTISYDKAVTKYNTCVWTGSVPSYETGKKTYAGKLLITQLDDPDYSGTITNLTVEGQGSSSRGYWKWNQEFMFSTNSIWTDGNGTRKGNYYQLSADDPKARDLVGKVNWASSQQSHKMGATKFFTDAWKSIVGGNGITKTTGYENSRVSVHEEPFLFFVRAQESDTPTFYCMMTLGQAKYDIPTFQGSSTQFPDYLAIEPKDNGLPIPLRQVPWITSEVTTEDNVKYYYNGADNIEIGLGDYTKLSYFISAYNFAYQNSLRIKPYSVAADLTDTSYQYWSKNTGLLMRYDPISKTWVSAGLTKTQSYTTHQEEQEDGTYKTIVDTLPVYTDFSITSQTGISIDTSDLEGTNNKFIEWRKSNFKSKVNLYYNVDDMIFHQCFIKFIAASDNRCKNTYEYLDPVSHKICFLQDDLDTIMASDNVGRLTKPYYVEEYDTDGSGSDYWNSSDNVFYDLVDKCYKSEMRVMMKRILDYLTNTYGSVKEGIEHYFMSTQEYFPAVAYNETTRLFYEEASVASVTLKDDGKTYKYSNGTPAISQALGDTKEAEVQWWKRRIPYMQSYASADPFYVRSTVESNQQFRSLNTSAGAKPSYSFTLTPWQWLYPKVGAGQSMGYDYTRVPAGTTYNTATLSTDGNTDTFIYGSDYYTSFGEFGGVSLGEAFNLNGTHLLEFSADSRKVSDFQFRPTSITVNCPVLRKLTLYGVSTLSGNIDLSTCKYLQSVDLRGTKLTGITLPESGSLTSLSMPDMESITMRNCPNITSFSINTPSGVKYLDTDNPAVISAIIGNGTNANSRGIETLKITSSGNLIELQESSNLIKALYAADSNVKGSYIIQRYPGSAEPETYTFTNSERFYLYNKYGDIHNKSNSTYFYEDKVSETVSDISGLSSISSETTSASYSVTCTGTQLYYTEWTVTGGKFQVNNSTSFTGLAFNLVVIPDTGTTSMTVTFKAHLDDGTTVTKTKLVSVVPVEVASGLVVSDDFYNVESVPTSSYSTTSSNTSLVVHYSVPNNSTCNVNYTINCSIVIVNNTSINLTYSSDSLTYGTYNMWLVDTNNVLGNSSEPVLGKMTLTLSDSKGTSYTVTRPILLHSHGSHEIAAYLPGSSSAYLGYETSSSVISDGKLSLKS